MIMHRLWKQLRFVNNIRAQGEFVIGISIG
jgi:hypothetical protein